MGTGGGWELGYRGVGDWRWQGEIAEAAEGIADGCAVAGTVPTAIDASTFARTHTYTYTHTQKGRGDRGVKSQAGEKGTRALGTGGVGLGVGKALDVFESAPEVEEEGEKRNNHRRREESSPDTPPHPHPTPVTPPPWHGSHGHQLRTGSPPSAGHKYWHRAPRIRRTGHSKENSCFF